MGKITHLVELLDMSPNWLHLFAAESDIDELEKLRKELGTRRKKILDELLKGSEAIDEIKRSIEASIGADKRAEELYNDAIQAARALLAAATFGLIDSILAFHYKVRTGTHELENPLEGCSDFIRSLYDKEYMQRMCRECVLK